MRYFNTYGPIEEDKHFFVPRTELLEDFLAQIDEGRYFTVFAPRQMGKTTLLRQLRDALLARADYIPILLDFEGWSNLSVERFLEAFFYDSQKYILKWLQDQSHPKFAAAQELLSYGPPADFLGLRTMLGDIHQLLPELKLVLIIDEFDAVPLDALSDLLQTWRSIYLGSTPPRSLHSVVLIGIQNIAALNMGRSSPFNIARELRLPNFSIPQVRYLLEQHTSDTGQAFDSEAVAEIFRLTTGQPFLTNRLTAIITEKLVPNREQGISEEVVDVALNQLVRERNYNFETTQRHSAEHQVDTMSILFGAEYPFTLNNPVVQELEMYGIINETDEGNCQIANPVYERVLFDYFRPFKMRLGADILVNGHDFRPFAADGKLQMEAVLSDFRQFVERRGREAFKVTETPQEATGQYLLSAFLDILVRQVGGDVFVEVPTGPGRLDLIVVHHGNRYVVETKIWRGQADFDAGVSQLAEYLETEGQPTGYFVVFHARPNVYGKLPEGELEFQVEEGGKTINAYLVRIGSSSE